MHTATQPHRHTHTYWGPRHSLANHTWCSTRPLASTCNAPSVTPRLRQRNSRDTVVPTQCLQPPLRHHPTQTKGVSRSIPHTACLPPTLASRHLYCAQRGAWLRAQALTGWRCTSPVNSAVWVASRRRTARGRIPTTLGPSVLSRGPVRLAWHTHTHSHTHTARVTTHHAGLHGHPDRRATELCRDHEWRCGRTITTEHALVQRHVAVKQVVEVEVLQHGRCCTEPHILRLCFT